MGGVLFKKMRRQQDILGQQNSRLMYSVYNYSCPGLWLGTITTNVENGGGGGAYFKD